MTEPDDQTRGAVTNTQRPKRARVALSDLSSIVRPAGRPHAVQAFTDAESAEAHAYAEAVGADVEPLAGK